MPKICPSCGTSYPDSNIFCATDGTTLRAADADGDLIGSVIADRYLVTDLLGEGGMGKVYLARHVRLPQQAAIKVLRPEQVGDASSLARFNREAANASSIDHDRVARVYDFGETSDGIVYLAMEYVAGRTLKAILASIGPMPPRRTATIVRQIADGLDAAHRIGIVHRDLKPDNVLVIESDDGEDRVKVVDFGIAKAFGADAGGAGLTRTGYVVGTPEFMSPEQLLGTAIDARSDVYALALVAYQCLTGELPFDLTTPDRGLTARLTQPPRLLTEVRPSVPWSPQVQAVFTSALERDPAQRPASAGAFARALASAIDAWDEPVVGGTAATPEPAPAPTAEASTAVIAPLTDRIARPHAAHPGTDPALRMPAVAPPVAGERRIAPPAPRRGMLIGAGAGVLVLAAAALVALTRRSGGGPDASTPVPAPPAAAQVVAPAPTPVPASVPETRRAARADTPSVPLPGASVVRPSAGLRITPPGGTVAAAATAATVPTPRSSARDARRTLDSITTALDPHTADAATGQAAIGALRGLLPRLTDATDSAWALVRLVDANMLAGDPGRACGAMRVARSAARSDAQREAIRRYDAVLDCP